LKPLGATAISTEASDELLVAMAQDGSSEAFALLFRRYRPAIARYAGRTLGDDARVEDIVQEVFLSALRSIGSLSRPAGFKPWLYRIAHNTCVDHVRRTGRAQEVSIDAGMLPASEEIRLFRQAPSSHAALTQKEDFKHLREAFGGLPPSQSEVLLMRELEGLTYDEIAARMGITRASVESMLFRARQGLRVEYGEIAAGERCVQMRPVMARMAEGMGGLRDRRALARHVRGCQSCRRDALAMGLKGPVLESPVPRLRGGLSRVAALLPLPWFLNRRPDETGAASSAGGSGGALATHAHTTIAQLGSTVGVSADQAATALQKAVAVVAAVAVVGGGGYVASKGASKAELLLKPDRGAVPGRAEVGPAVPPALAPLQAAHRETAAGALTPAAGAALPTIPAATSVPALAPAAGAAPGTLVTPTTPPAAGAPSEPAGSTPGGSAPESGTPDSTSGPESTIPAAGDPAPSDPGSSGGAGGGSAEQGGGGNGGGASGGGSDSGGSGATDPPYDGSVPPADTPPPAACDLPPGLDKKDKIPPGHAKKCGLEAAAEPAP
jgi:RNA polymerase sigma factor (sigma-70 family)